VGGKTSRLILNLYSIPPPIRLAARLAGCLWLRPRYRSDVSQRIVASASASRLDPTPAVTVGRLQPLRVFRNALCVPAFLNGFCFFVLCFVKKPLKEKCIFF